jgi:PilZ domain
MSLNTEKRKTSRVEFSRGIPVQMVAIDGTWRRSCLMLDAAASGAKLKVKKSVEGLNLKEFFLILSTTGVTYRRCELAWINGEELGVQFLETTDNHIKRPSPIKNE